VLNCARRASPHVIDMTTALAQGPGKGGEARLESRAGGLEGTGQGGEGARKNEEKAFKKASKHKD
jgi:hypothetical protein